MSSQKHIFPKSLAVEGNIGAGKSTFLTMVKKYLNVHIVYEPCDQWQNVEGENLLEAFYNDTPRWAYTFQSYAFITRLLAQEAASVVYDHKIHILERSVFSDRYCFAKNCYESGLMSSLEWKLYTEWFGWLTEKYVPIPSAFIYLQTDPEICYKRLLKRNRTEEHLVPLDYIKKIDQKHESWLINKEYDGNKHIRDVPVLVLSCSTDFEDNKEEQERLIEKIIVFCNEMFNIPAHELKR